MLVLLTSFCFLWQEYYYLDGVEITLRDGTIIRTAEEITETLVEISWREDGVFISIPHSQIKNRKPFTMRVKGRPPREKSQSTVNQRISGQAGSFEQNGVIFFKVLHVNERGRSMEGVVARNVVSSVKLLADTPLAGLLLQVDMERVDPGKRTELRFFDLKGRRIQTENIDPERIKRTKKEQKDFRLSYQFRLPPQTEAMDIGLVQAINFRK